QFDDFTVTPVLQPTYGDINGDGVVGIADARLVLQHLVGKYVIPEEKLPYAKVSGGAEVTIADARLILQRIVGKIGKFPPET
ncbi:MAG: dockerin type I repeat-containing protein, partial [Oscillospiraceae bacterium]|nr:dockerin type I repeat-containing protein [Oscillospiraceae bacterium]